MSEGDGAPFLLCPSSGLRGGRLCARPRRFVLGPGRTAGSSARSLAVHPTLLLVLEPGCLLSGRWRQQEAGEAGAWLASLGVQAVNLAGGPVGSCSLLPLLPHLPGDAVSPRALP